MTALEPTPPRAWAMLAVGVLAQVAGTVFVTAPAFLTPPMLRTARTSPSTSRSLARTLPTIFIT